MARKSLLTPALPEKELTAAERIPESPPVLPPQEPKRRAAKRHIGAYFDRKDPLLIAFDKLGIDLDKQLQDMLYEAIQDYVDKHRAQSAFHEG